MKKSPVIRHSILIFIAHIILYSGCLMPWESGSAPIPFIHITPLDQKVSLNSKCFIEIRAENVNNLFAAPFYLQYDPKVLKFESAVEGTFLNRNNTEPATLLYSNDANQGRIIVGLTRLGSAPGINGSGLLMTVYFKAVNTGVSELSFSNASIRITNSDSAVVSAKMDFIGSKVTVE